MQIYRTMSTPSRACLPEDRSKTSSCPKASCSNSDNWQRCPSHPGLGIPGHLPALFGPLAFSSKVPKLSTAEIQQTMRTGCLSIASFFFTRSCMHLPLALAGMGFSPSMLGSHRRPLRWTTTGQPTSSLQSCAPQRARNGNMQFMSHASQACRN